MAELFKFKISTGLKDIIGKELITEDHIAIFELVKNAYDANAKNVKIIFENVVELDNENSKIIIIDNGNGMSKNDILHKWLFVGFSEKKETTRENYSQSGNQKKRIFAGSKGIGRFSADKLGRHLTMYTRKDKGKFHVLKLNWNAFEKNQNKEFETINTEYEGVDAVPEYILKTLPLSKGTILEISFLHNNWNTKKLLELKKYLQRLISPVTSIKDPNFEIEIIANEYKNYDNKCKKSYEIINGIVKSFVFEKLGIKTTQIACKVENNIISTYLYDKDKRVVNYEEENSYDLLNNITVNLFYLNQRAKKEFTTLMGIQPAKYGSIFLYRNGFRVYTYGDVENDWLGLKLRKAQGYSRYISDREVIGKVEIMGIQPEFKEPSSRSEGLIKTPAYDQLVEFLKSVLITFEKYIVQGLEWDVDDDTFEENQKRGIEVLLKILNKNEITNIQWNDNLPDILNERSEKIPEILKNFESVVEKIESKEEKKHFQTQLKMMKNFTKTMKKERKELERKYKIKEKQYLFVDKAISTKTEEIINLVHSIKTASTTIKDEIYRMNKKIYNNDIKSITKNIDQIDMHNQKIFRYSDIVSHGNFNLLSLKSETIEIDVAQYISQYMDLKINKENDYINTKVINKGASLLKVISIIDIALIFDNLLENASKFDATMFKVLLEMKGKNLRILIGNNGETVAKEDQEFLFSRGFSTEKDGSGLGLFYCRYMIKLMGGSIKFLGNGVPNMGKGACFEIIL